jgi:hypothetical protein
VGAGPTSHSSVADQPGQPDVSRDIDASTPCRLGLATTRQGARKVTERERQERQRAELLITPYSTLEMPNAGIDIVHGNGEEACHRSPFRGFAARVGQRDAPPAPS